MSFLQKQESRKNSLNIDKINLKKQVFLSVLLDSCLRRNDIIDIHATMLRGNDIEQVFLGHMIKQTILRIKIKIFT
ncbi:MAG TPA: hypothetical protein LFV92_04945 [Rickettsia endosymbiont of Ceroptres masudai]|nr:hypothetical protein [Rickettsia endosymbiont of Ceroptres masudai]